MSRLITNEGPRVAPLGVAGSCNPATFCSHPWCPVPQGVTLKASPSPLGKGASLLSNLDGHHALEILTLFPGPHG